MFGLQYYNQGCKFIFTVQPLITGETACAFFPLSTTIHSLPSLITITRKISRLNLVLVFKTGGKTFEYHGLDLSMSP